MKTLLLTSAGMKMLRMSFANDILKEEILKLLPRPANQIKLAHITTASKAEDDISYVKKDSQIMADVGFHVQEIDIEGKNEDELRMSFANDILKEAAWR
ncbi:MAG: hypothetical protein WC650_03785 [Candidatus Doudnabacteria bacterium]